jgi:ubiquinone/menaquinone biosynthesis C-methylase UbiE
VSRTTRELRDRTQAHYDKYTFRLDQRAIMDEKMNNRLMGAAILALDSPDQIILDVGCGACRVAQMVREEGRGRVVSIDISLETLRGAKSHNPDPLLNADNMNIPIRSESADLVISNGVIMVTPDAHASFDELARITRPGGTLVVSVYDRHSWYYPVYTYGGPIVRKLRDWFGDTGLKLTLFPLFHVASLALLAVVLRRPAWVPIDMSWNIFHDQFTTPHCTFHTFEEVSEWAEAAGLICEEKRSEAARQLASFRLRKPTRD